MAKAVRLSAVLTLALCVTPALSQQQVPLIEGCEAVATVLKDGCTATTVQRCENAMIDDTYVNGTRIDRHIFDDQWSIIGYAGQQDSFVIRIDPAKSDKASLDELEKTGEIFTKKVGKWETGVIKDRDLIVEETYTLSDEVVTISGIPFRKGRIKRLSIINERNRDLDSLWEFDLYLSEDRSIFFEGGGGALRNGRDLSKGRNPVAIALPGQPGFRADRSEVGCE